MISAISVNVTAKALIISATATNALGSCHQLHVTPNAESEATADSQREPRQRNAKRQRRLGPAHC